MHVLTRNLKILVAMLPMSPVDSLLRFALCQTPWPRLPQEALVERYKIISNYYLMDIVRKVGGFMPLSIPCAVPFNLAVVHSAAF